MPTKDDAVNRGTCTELVESVLRQAAEGVKFPVRGDAVVAQLNNVSPTGSYRGRNTTRQSTRSWWSTAAARPDRRMDPLIRSFWTP